MEEEGKERKNAGKDARTRILNDPIIKTLFWLAGPAILANFVNISYNFIDAIWLGKLGKEAFDAPTVSWPLIFFFISFGTGFITAGVSIIAQYYGAGERDKARKSAGNLLLTSILISFLVSYPTALLSKEILTLMGIPSTVLPLANTYIRIILLATPMAYIGVTFTIIAHALGDTRTPMIINVLSSGINIVLDPFLIFGLAGLPKLGVMGAAIATVIARGFTTVYSLLLLFKWYDVLRLSLNDLRIEKDWLKKIYKIGLPLAIQRSSNSLGFTIMMAIVSYFGPVAIAAYGVAIRVIDLFQAITSGIGRATSIMVGQNIGAQKYDRALSIVKTALLTIIILLSIGSFLIIAIKTHIVWLFVDEPEVIEEGSRLLSLFAVSLPFFGLFFVSSGVASGSGHTKIIAIISILRLWVFRVGLSLLLGFVMTYGLLGVWYAVTFSNIIAGVLAIVWVARKSWLKRIIEE